MKKLVITISLTAVVFVFVSLQPVHAGRNDSSELPPRKVVIGTVIHGYYGVKYPGLDTRLSEVEELIDSVAEESNRKYPTEGLDLVVLPEEIITIGKRGNARERSVPLEGTVLDRMGRKARQYSTYLIVPLDLVEKDGTTFNSAVLLDREGKVAGIYRKVHLVAALGSNVLEGGHSPGKEFAVFECDFGRIGIQICFDMSLSRRMEGPCRKGRGDCCGTDHVTANLKTVLLRPQRSLLCGDQQSPQQRNDLQSCRADRCTDYGWR